MMGQSVQFLTSYNSFPFHFIIQMDQGFADFSQLGTFLNEENKQLTEQVLTYIFNTNNYFMKFFKIIQVKALTEQVADLDEQIAEQNDRKAIMKQSLESLKAQLAETVALVREKVGSFILIIFMSVFFIFLL